MHTMNRAYQRGITLSGLIFAGVFVFLVAILGIKVAPEVIEYAKIASNIKAVAQDPALRMASQHDVRQAYARRAIVDHTSAVPAQDLQISNSGNSLVLSFAYRKEIHLVGPVSLVIDFEASTDQ